MPAWMARGEKAWDGPSMSNTSKAEVELQSGTCELFIFMPLYVCFVFLYLFAFPFLFQQNLSFKNLNLIQFKPREKILIHT